MKTITAKEYREKHNGKEAFTDTAFGKMEFNSINENYWVRCPKANGGFGRSFSLHAQSEIHLAVINNTNLKVGDKIKFHSASSTDHGTCEIHKIRNYKVKGRRIFIISDWGYMFMMWEKFMNYELVA